MGYCSLLPATFLPLLPNALPLFDLSFAGIIPDNLVGYIHIIVAVFVKTNIRDTVPSIVILYCKNGHSFPLYFSVAIAMLHQYECVQYNEKQHYAVSPCFPFPFSNSLLQHTLFRKTFQILVPTNQSYLTNDLKLAIIDVFPAFLLTRYQLFQSQPARHNSRHPLSNQTKQDLHV